MPIVRKLAPEEVREIENKGKSQRKLIEEEYDQFLSDYQPGDYGLAELEDDETRLTVRNRFKAAAQRWGLQLQFIRTTGNTVRFRVISADEAVGRARQKEVVRALPRPQEATIEMPAPPQKRRGGRPRKTT